MRGHSPPLCTCELGRWKGGRGGGREGRGVGKKGIEEREVRLMQPSSIGRTE